MADLFNNHIGIHKDFYRRCPVCACIFWNRKRCPNCYGGGKIKLERVE